MEIRSGADLDKALLANGCLHYVYVLRQPDGVACYGGIGTPFYVGIGQRGRLFEHEKAAKEGTEAGRKVDAINEIWSSGREVVRTIDSFHQKEPWIREGELIHEIGRIDDRTGPLTNPQTYSASHVIEGVELRKYAADQVAAGGVDAIPAKFKLKNIRLKEGPVEPRSPTSCTGPAIPSAGSRRPSSCAGARGRRS